jgi:hypothetical protein
LVSFGFSMSQATLCCPLAELNSSPGSLFTVVVL